MSAVDSIFGVGFATMAYSFAINLVIALVIAIACNIVIGMILKVIARVLNATPRFETGMKQFMLTAMKIVLWFVAVIIIAPRFGIEVASLVALLSVAGIAFSLSIQGIMTNVFSGITVLAVRPFVVGDFVEIGGVLGTVSTIGLFYSNVLTIDNKYVSVPNSEITSSKVINYSHEELRRVDLNFCASYDDSTASVKSAILEVLNADSRILHEPAEPFVGLLSYKDSCIEYVSRSWVKGSDYWDVFFATNEAVRESFAKNGVQMTYNHMNVHVIEK